MKITVLSKLFIIGSTLIFSEHIHSQNADDMALDMIEEDEAMNDMDMEEETEDKPLNFYTAGLAVIDIQDGVFNSLFNSLLADDVVVCYEYSLTLIWDFVVKMMELFLIEFKLQSLFYEFAVVVHKYPIVFKECMRPIGDVEYIDELFLIAFDIRNINFWIHTFENVLFNSGDIFQNIIEANDAFLWNDYFKFGEHLGRIISDLFIVSTLDGGYLENLSYTLETMDPRWSPSHSQIINTNPNDESQITSKKVQDLVNQNSDGMTTAGDHGSDHTMVMSSKPKDLIQNVKSEFGYQLKGLSKTKPNVMDNKQKIDQLFISKGTKFEYTDMDKSIHERIQQIKPYGDHEKTILQNAQQNEIEALTELIDLLN